MWPKKYEYTLKTHSLSNIIAKVAPFFKISVCSAAVSMETNTFNQPSSKRLHVGVCDERHKRKSETDDRKWITASVNFKDWLWNVSFNKLRNINVSLYWFSIFEGCLFLYLRRQKKKKKKNQRRICMSWNWVRDRACGIWDIMWFYSNTCGSKH